MEPADESGLPRFLGGLYGLRPELCRPDAGGSGGGKPDAGGRNTGPDRPQRPSLAAYAACLFIDAADRHSSLRSAHVPWMERTLRPVFPAGRTVADRTESNEKIKKTPYGVFFCAQVSWNCPVYRR